MCESNGNVITLNNLTNSGSINDAINANQNASLAGNVVVVSEVTSTSFTINPRNGSVFNRLIYRSAAPCRNADRMTSLSRLDQLPKLELKGWVDATFSTAKGDSRSTTGLTRRAVEFKLTPMLAAESKVAGNNSGHASKTDPAHSWKKIVEPVEPFLHAVTQQLVRQARDFDPQLVPFAEHALNGSGKHLRSTLVALAASCFGKPDESHVRVAVIIEMVHLATLVHDDVMDEAEIRRGIPTVASKWGNEIAVLFGDCLFAQALKLAAGFPTPEVCRAVSMATNTVCTGEIIQTQQRLNFVASRRDYFRVIEMKTGELFTLSCDLAAFLSSATDEQRSALKEFGAAFGTAYQVFDDCVDLYGTEADAGKSLGTDLAKGKLTWPLLLVWDRANAKDRAELEAAIKNWQPENLGLINKLLLRYETFEPSVREIEKFLELARRALRVMPNSAGRAGLSAMTDFLAQQTAALAVQ